MKKICLTCQNFHATHPWCGHCRKAPCHTNYTKDGCGSYRPASSHTLDNNLKSVEIFKGKHPESIDPDLIGVDTNQD